MNPNQDKEPSYSRSQENDQEDAELDEIVRDFTRSAYQQPESTFLNAIYYQQFKEKLLAWRAKTVRWALPRLTPTRIDFAIFPFDLDGRAYKQGFKDAIALMEDMFKETDNEL